MRVWLAVILAWITAGLAEGQNPCRIYLADQFNSAQGFSLSLEAPADSSGVCSLSAVSLNLSAGDGTGFHHVSSNQPWQTGVVYTAKAVITASGPQQLSLDGRALGTTQGAFRPAQTTLYGSDLADLGTAAEGYIITQISLQVSNGTNTVSIAPGGGSPIPIQSILMSQQVPWPANLVVDPSQPTTVTATFRFDPLVSNPHQLDPYVDAYGQATFSTWPGKVTGDSDLQAATVEEKTWLASNGPIGGLDAYGGSTLAGWTDQATGYYHTAFHNNRWWLISPLGNPLFYIGLDNVSDQPQTPITGRESTFASLPSTTGDFAAAYAQNIWGDAQNTTYVSFSVSNLIRKYGSSWRQAHIDSISHRLSSWVFAGSGKWAARQPGAAFNPVLDHSAVANVVAGGHPDVWDANVLKQLAASLAAQVGSDATNPYVLGWSVGNEKDEVVGPQEIQAVLALGASVPAKRALVDQALSAIYSGRLSALASAWKIVATTVADVYAAKPTPPASDVETLRQFYESVYYSTLYKTVKTIDPNHLYLGSWTQPRSHPTEWPIVAANCDVVGFDLYSPTFLDSNVQALIQSTKKPVLVGEFSFPADYGGMRGFGIGSYQGETALTDSQAGDLYAEWLSDAGANPYVVGVEWFEYFDEPITGRGNNDGETNISPSLVLGENTAFGMVDITDRPKYDLVDKVRAANITTLQSLQLLGPAPILTTAPANGATYVAGGLVPGSFAIVKGTGLADAGVNRVWQASDFVGLGNALPTDLSGVQVFVNGTAAAVYYVSPTQVSFQVPAGISGAANVYVTRDGIPSNTMSVQAVSSAPGIFPIILNGTNYAAGVFLDGKIVGDPAVSPAFRKAKAGDAIALFVTGLAPSPAGVIVGILPIGGVTATIGTTVVPADFAGLVAAGEFQINLTLPQSFASLPEGNYPITISVNGISSPAMINSNPPAPVVIPVQH